jgi:iron complex transport system ATP-binding protein
MNLEVTNIRFSYNGHLILSDVTFSIESGQIVCVLGENGAGKSTLLKCLNRILRPQKGSVLADGEDILHISRNKIARLIGYVPQRHPETQLTVFEAVLMGRKPYIQWSLGQDDYALAEEVIEQMGIAHLAMRKVCNLSGGEIQKVIIARALAQSPEVLLLDEPTSNLDLKNQLEVMGLVRSIVETKGISAIIAIHDLNIALRFADRFIFLKNGRIHGICGKNELCSEMIQQVYGVDVALSEVNGHTLIVPL